MKRRHYWFLAIAVIVILVISAVGTRIGQEANNVKPMDGYLAPNFNLADLDGKKVELNNIIALHKVTLVNFWATWCPPCRAEVPELVEFYRRNATKGVTVLAVNLREEPEVVKIFTRKAKMQFPILMDTTGIIGDRYQVYAIPTTFLIDQKGKIRSVIQGGTDLQTLESKVQSILKGK